MDILGQFAFLFDSETGRLNPYACPTTFAIGVALGQAILTGSISAFIGVHRGLSGIRWFWIGFLLGVLGVLVALIRRGPKQMFSPKRMGKTPSTHEPVDCEGCGHANHPAAEVCLGCGVTLAPVVVSEASVIGRGAAG
jgi:hypothetical protein